MNVYLPKGTEWYDFWSNRRYKGGQTIKRLAPIDIIPVFVKAGSIIPFGSQVQYSNEKPWDNLEIRVYPGADGEFIFYEDEGDSYNYEKGAFSEITFRWNERRGTLTISDRKGSFDGMLASRKFRVLLVDGNSPSGDKEPATFTQEVEYNGKEIVLQLAESIIPANYDEVTGYIKNPGRTDDEPMTTLSLHFTQTKSNAPLEIGVATDGAPRNTWFKIDNFRLYKKK